MRRCLVGIVLTAVVGAMSVVVASPAQAVAQGCQVGKWPTPPARFDNTGGAICQVLTNGSQVRAVVWCGSELFPPKYGPWVSRARTWSTYNCGGNAAVQVDWDIR